MSITPFVLKPAQQDATFFNNSDFCRQHLCCSYKTNGMVLPVK